MKNIDDKIFTDFGIFPYQEKACTKMVEIILDKTEKNRQHNIILKAITGAGKTIMLIKTLDMLIELNKNGIINKDINILWFSYNPELNVQSNAKVEIFSKNFTCFDTEMIDESNVNLESNKICFINGQKLSDSAVLKKKSEKLGYKDFYDLLKEIKKNNLKVLVIDECHNGVKKESIMDALIDNYNPDIIIAASATPAPFKSYHQKHLLNNYTMDFIDIELEEVKEEGIIKDNIVLLKENSKNEDYISSTLTKTVVEDYKKIVKLWEHYKSMNPSKINNNENIKNPPVILIQVEDKFEEKINDFTNLVRLLINHSKDENSLYRISSNNIYHTIGGSDNIRLNDPEKTIIQYIPASQINDKKDLKVVIFKKNLQEGWDCPRAEILYSIRSVKSPKDIAQILGRVLRNPFKENIIDEELSSLMSVYFYAPNYESKLLYEIAKEINDKIKIEEKDKEEELNTYNLKIDENFVNKVNNLEIPSYQKEKKDNPYRKLLYYSMNNNINSKIEIQIPIAKEIIQSTKGLITEDNVRGASSENINKSKLKIEDFYNGILTHEEEILKQKKELSDLETSFRRKVTSINLLDYSSEPEESFLFSEIEEMIENNLLNKEIEIIKSVYPEIGDNQIIKVYWLTIINYCDLNEEINKIAEYKLLKLNVPSNWSYLNSKNESVFKLKESFQKTFNSRKVYEDKKNQCAVSIYGTNKTVINKDSELEEKVIPYLNNNLDSWMRNYTDKDSLKIRYRYEREYKVFNPDFIGFKNNKFTIIETKAKAFDDHINKLKGALEFCEKHSFELIWIIENKNSYYLVNYDSALRLKDELTNSNILDVCSLIKL